MFLMKKAVENELNVYVNFERIVDDLLMISVENETYDNSILSYWRLTKVIGIPPLEIGINCEKKILKSIVFYVDAECLHEYKDIVANTQKGNVIIDTDIFKKENDYIDVEQSYNVCLHGNKLICIFANVEKVLQSYRNDRLELYFDSDERLIGFSICDLTKKEIELIKSL